MDNRIVDVIVEDRSLDPISAEVWVAVEPERLTPTTELRGRFVGPSCPYATTIEIAYPLIALRQGSLVPREGRLPVAEREGYIRARAAIPEASLWHPQTPFLYAGFIELWEDGRLCDRATIRHGLRHLVRTPNEVRINGKVVTIDGREETTLTPERLAELRANGCNCVTVPLTTDNEFLWDEADRIGMLLIGRVDSTPDQQQRAARLSRRACCLGWVLGNDVV